VNFTKNKGKFLIAQDEFLLDLKTAHDQRSVW